MRDGKLLTPPLGASVLPGITRDTAVKIARPTSAFRWSRRLIPRELLYIADEVFFTGTAAEVTPVRSVDRIKVGSGTPRTDHGANPAALFRYPGRLGEGRVRLVDAGGASA